jgi:hypothetical protein
MRLETAIWVWEHWAWETGANSRIENIIGVRLWGHVEDAQRVEVAIRHLLAAPLIDRRKMKERLTELRSCLDAAQDACDALFVNWHLLDDLEFTGQVLETVANWHLQDDYLVLELEPDKDEEGN